MCPTPCLEEQRDERCKLQTLRKCKPWRTAVWCISQTHQATASQRKKLGGASLAAACGRSAADLFADAVNLSGNARSRSCSDSRNCSRCKANTCSAWDLLEVFTYLPGHIKSWFTEWPPAAAENVRAANETMKWPCGLQVRRLHKDFRVVFCNMDL